MKVVLDTNVVVSGIFWGGAPLKILERGLRKKVDLIASQEILEEYLRTIKKISSKINRPDLYDQWSLILPASTRLNNPRKSFRLCRDPDDNKFLDCAISGKADYLVSGDQDLLVLKRVMRVQILSPRAFLRI